MAVWLVMYRVRCIPVWDATLHTFVYEEEVVEKLWKYSV